MIWSSPSATKATWLLILCVLIRASDATIKVVQDGTEFLSRPDHNLGLQMKEGMEYFARIQRIHGDEHLCKGNPLHVHVPDDGRPGMCLFCSCSRENSIPSSLKHCILVVGFDYEFRLMCLFFVMHAFDFVSISWLLSQSP